MVSAKISKSFFAICLGLTGLSLVSEDIFHLLSAEPLQTYWWQYLTGAFLHGTKGQPILTLVHFILNSILILTVGRWVEHLIGTKRFLWLCLSTWLGFLGTQWISGIWINGSSGIIWAWSPFLVIIKNSKSQGSEQAKGLLILMWGIITVFMGVIPGLFNPENGFFYSLLFGNLFHFTGTCVGFIFYLNWRNQLLAKID